MFNKLPILLSCTLFWFGLIPSISQSENASDTQKVACEPYQLPISSENIRDYSDYPYTESLIWKAVKDDKVNFLYGTIHTQDQMATRFPPQVRLAIYQSKTYLMEIQLSQETNDIFQQAMFYKDGESLKGKIDPILLNILGNQLSQYGYETNDAKRIKPWAAFSTIGAPKPTRQPSLDQVLMNYAGSRGLEVIGIETMQELVDSLASISKQDQLTILGDTICNRSKIIADTKQLVDMHMRNNLLGLVKFNEQPHQDEALFERYMQTMVFDRNQRMHDRILPYFEKGATTVAVGALHLPGEKGLLKLLEQSGFKISPL